MWGRRRWSWRLYWWGRRLSKPQRQAGAIPTDEAAFRTAAVGRRPYISARASPEGLLGGRTPPEVSQDWVALSVDGSHIDVDRHLPLRCHLINLGGCILTHGKDPQLPAVQRAGPGCGGR